MEQEFNTIVEEYERLKQVAYVSANIDNIDEEVFCWKTKLQNFLVQYKDAEQNSKIIEMQQNIAQKREEIEILSRIKYIQPSEVPFFNTAQFESVITKLSIFGDKDSVSNSLILRGEYNCKPVFLKVFDSTSSIKRELYIYSHISRAEEELKEDVKLYVDGYSIKLKLAFCMDKDEFFRFLEEKKIEQIKTGSARKLYYSSSDDAVIKSIPTIFSSNFLYFIVTEDIEGYSLRYFIENCDFIARRRKDNANYRLDLLSTDIKKDFINLFFELFYSIYILNHYLKIEHNDLHLGNIMIKKEVNPIKKKFIIGNLKIEKKSNWRIAIYDFDKSKVISEKTNVDVTKMWEKLFSDRPLPQYISPIVGNIHLYIYYNSVIETDDPENPGEKNYEYEQLPQDQKENLYYPENMLKRFIKVFFNELEIEEVNPFFKKYLKYKNKYLKYKNNKL
jgi:hypothetical protein